MSEVVKKSTIRELTQHEICAVSGGDYWQHDGRSEEYHDAEELWGDSGGSGGGSDSSEGSGGGSGNEIPPCPHPKVNMQMGVNCIMGGTSTD